MRVFISSTTAGLGSYRRFAAEFLKDWHNVEPVLQEGLTGDHASAVTYLGHLITSCDRAICLIGPYCGSCPSDQPPDQRRSYTQLEYDIANRSGLPVHILDGRQCQLDPGCQSAEERQMQEAFWEEVERLDRRLRPAFHDKAHLSRLLLRLIKDWELGPDSLRSLPTPFFRWRRQLQDRASSALASFGEMLEFVVCMAAAEVGHPDPLPITEVDDLLKRASQNGFVTELRYLEFVEYLKWHKQAKQTRVPPSRKDITSRFEIAMQLLRVLDVYLLVRVERHDSGVRLRVYRGPTPAWENDLEPCEGLAPTAYQGELHLLDTRRRESLRLSPYLQPLPEEPDILCMWWRESPEQPVQLLPFADLHDPVRAPHPGPSPASPTALLATHSWCTLVQHYPPGDRQVGEYCGDWRIIGAATETRNLVQLFLATRDDPTDLPAGLWRAKDGLDETARRRIGEQFHRWYDYARLEPELVGRVLHFEPGKRPAIVAAIPPGMRPLSRFLAPGAPPMDLNDQPLRRLVCGVVKLCRFLASQGVRLIHCSPADLYWDGEEQCQLVGVGSTLADGECLPQDPALWDVLGGNAPPIVAPELASGAASIASEIFAIGVLLQSCRRQTMTMSLSAGDRNDTQDANMRDEWRNDPLECLVFHCLARHPHRRFISLENFLSYFDICTAPNALARLTKPEMISLRGGLRISRCLVTNFQYERFCCDRRQDAPAQSLPWEYATPFAPVVGVSAGDCEDYCAWLGKQYGGEWRLPTAAEWMAAAGTEVFPWGSEAPSPTLANYDGAHWGPTVVGAYPWRDHGNGLRDMAGNVWEWCSDRTPDGPWRVLKGGSFASPGRDLQVTMGNQRIAGGRYVDVGFRVVQKGGNSWTK